MTPAPLLSLKSEAPSARATGLERIGDLLMHAGRLSAAEVERIVQYQQHHDLRFGDAAIALGLLGPDEVLHALGQQYAYPTSPRDQRLTGFPIVQAPYTQEAEAFRQIRTRILLARTDQQPLSLAIAGPDGDEGLSYVATSLALAFAQNRQATVLINANLRRPRSEGLYDPHRTLGLSTVLSGRSQVDQSLTETPLETLQLLDAGPLPPNPAELLMRPGLRDTLNWLSQHFEVLILEAPAINRFPDTLMIARQTQGCLLVGRQHHTRLDALQTAAQLVQSTGGQLLGSVFNGHPAPGSEAPPSRIRWPRRHRS